MKALAADDSKVARRVLREILTDIAPDIEVDSADNGRQAVEMHATRNYDVIFLDVTMPEMDGIEALKAIRGKDPDVFVGILTALEDGDALADAERYGASVYITKPFSSLDLQAALQIVTGRPPAVRVLLIDDSRTQRTILRTALSTLESAADLKCEVDEAVDGPEGLRMALSGAYDIVFLDINMPGLNGVEVLREIKRGQRRAKVVMLSGAIDEVYETRLSTLGADACLAKPVDITEVLTCVVAMLDVRQPPRRAA